LPAPWPLEAVGALFEMPEPFSEPSADFSFRLTMELEVSDLESSILRVRAGGMISHGSQVPEKDGGEDSGTENRAEGISSLALKHFFKVVSRCGRCASRSATCDSSPALSATQGFDAPAQNPGDVMGLLTRESMASTATSASRTWQKPCSNKNTKPCRSHQNSFCLVQGPFLHIEAR
jgi:hypothetical protein